MNFFDTSDLVESKYSMADYREWAGEIANSYLNAGAIPTDTLTKIARTSELTPHQINILASEANKLIHTTKYASEANKYFAAEFPLADANNAISALQLAGEVKTAAQFIDPICSDTGPDVYDMFGIKPEELDKTASVKHQMKAASQKAILLNQKIDDKLFEIKTASETAKHNFIKQARQYIIDEPNSLARMKMLGVMDHFVKSAGLPAGKVLLAKLAYVLGKEGKLEPKHVKIATEYFTKSADQTVPEELISKDLPANIVNGEHPLYITLKTVGDNEADLLRYVQESTLVQDKVRLLGQKIRAL
jgi:hypothetical protein